MSHTHSQAELTALERATGLTFVGFLDAGDVLLPILVRPGRTPSEIRALVLRLNNRYVAPAPPETAQAEKRVS